MWAVFFIPFALDKFILSITKVGVVDSLFKKYPQFTPKFNFIGQSWVLGGVPNRHPTPGLNFPHGPHGPLPPPPPPLEFPPDSASRSDPSGVDVGAPSPNALFIPS